MKPRESVIKKVKECLKLYRQTKVKHFSELLNPKDWRPLKSAPRFPGAYVLLKNKKPIYVGMSRDVGGRLSQLFLFTKASNKISHALTEHLLDKWKKFSTMGKLRNYYLSLSVKILEAQDLTEANLFEKVLIYHLRPIYNLETRYDLKLKP